MDDLQAISAITNWETAKAKRSARKGKITRLKKRLDEFALTPLEELQSYSLNKLRDDLYKEKKLHEALQYRCEQLLEAKVGVTEEQITKEIETGEESNDLHSDILHQADVLKVTLGHYLEAQGIQREYDTLVEVSDPSVGEFEKDCSKVQRKISVFLNQTASFNKPSIMNIRETFIKHEMDIVARLNNSRGSRRDKRDSSAADTSTSEAPRPSRSSKLRLDLPDFSGHPLDWHHFHQLFTSALDRAGDDFSDREKACFLIKAMKSPEAE